MEDPAITKAISEALATIAERKGVYTFESPRDVLHDSLDSVEFIVSLEEFLGINIDDERILGIDTSSIDSLAKSISIIISEKV